MLLRALAASIFACAMLAAQAQPWPARAVRIVVPFPAGGPTDVLTRSIGDKLATQLGTAVVIENKPGAGGTIGADFVAKSAPDGYTFVMATSSTHSVGPYLAKVPYDPSADFTPVIWIGDATQVLVVSPELHVKSLGEFIDYARRHPGLNYATSGIGSVVHLTSEQFAAAAGIRITHIPYKGIQQSIPDLISGQVALLFDNIMTVQPHVKAGRVTALGISAPRRSPLMPDLPTLDEGGLRGFESRTWFGIFGPAGLPRPVVERMNAEFNRTLADATVRDRFTQLGFDPAGGTPDQFAAMVAAQSRKWSKVIQESNVKAE